MTHFYQHLPSPPSLSLPLFYPHTYSVAYPLLYHSCISKCLDSSSSQSIWLPSVVCSALSTLCILTLFTLSGANFPPYPSHIYSKSLTSVSYCKSFCECTVQNTVPPHQADCFLSGCTTVGAPSPSHLNICPSHYRSHRRIWAPFPHSDSNAGEKGEWYIRECWCQFKAPDYVSQLAERRKESPGGRANRSEHPWMFWKYGYG